MNVGYGKELNTVQKMIVTERLGVQARIDSVVVG